MTNTSKLLIPAAVSFVGGVLVHWYNFIGAVRLADFYRPTFWEVRPGYFEDLLFAIAIVLVITAALRRHTRAPKAE